MLCAEHQVPCTGRRNTQVLQKDPPLCHHPDLCCAGSRAPRGACPLVIQCLTVLQAGSPQLWAVNGNAGHQDDGLHPYLHPIASAHHDTPKHCSCIGQSIHQTKSQSEASTYIYGVCVRGGNAGKFWTAQDKDKKEDTWKRAQVCCCLLWQVFRFLHIPAFTCRMPKTWPGPLGYRGDVECP